MRNSSMITDELALAPLFTNQAQFSLMMDVEQTSSVLQATKVSLIKK
jgi:hypothetical protein